MVAATALGVVEAARFVELDWRGWRWAGGQAGMGGGQADGRWRVAERKPFAKGYWRVAVFGGGW